jgi:hypothetical protein
MNLIRRAVRAGLTGNLLMRTRILSGLLLARTGLLTLAGISGKSLALAVPRADRLLLHGLMLYRLMLYRFTVYVSYCFFGTVAGLCAANLRTAGQHKTAAQNRCTCYNGKYSDNFHRL